MCVCLCRGLVWSTETDLQNHTCLSHWVSVDTQPACTNIYIVIAVCKDVLDALYKLPLLDLTLRMTYQSKGNTVFIVCLFQRIKAIQT